MPGLTPGGADGPAIPFTCEQEWYLTKTGRAGRTHKNVRLSYEILGKLDVPALVQAAHGFAARHDALQMALVTDTGRARAQLVRPLGTDESVVSCQSVNAASAEQFSRYASALHSRDYVTPWTDPRSRPFTLRLLRRDEGHHAFLATFQNLVFDGRAHALFGHELWRDYQALIRGEQPPTAAPAFSAAAVRRRERSDPARTARALESWRERLEFAARHPWVRPDGAPATEDGTVRVEFHADATRAIRASCERERCTVMQWVVGAFVRALAARGGQRRVSLWTSMDSRSSAERDVVGMFAGSAPLAIREPGAGRRAVLAEVRGQLLGALRHQQVTAAEIASLADEFAPADGAAFGGDVYLNLRSIRGELHRTRELGPLRIAVDAYPLRRITFANSWALQLRCDEYQNAILIDLLFDGRRVGRPLAQAVLDRMAADITDSAES